MPYITTSQKYEDIQYSLYGYDTLKGYVCCYDVALQISWETGWDIRSVNKRNIISTIPILDWVSTEHEIDDFKCCLLL